MKNTLRLTTLEYNLILALVLKTDGQDHRTLEITDDQRQLIATGLRELMGGLTRKILGDPPVGAIKPRRLELADRPDELDYLN